MKTQYTAGQFRRNEKRIAKHAQTVEDNSGMICKITASRRILATHNPMTGGWDSPTAADGQVRGTMRYVYLVGEYQPAAVYNINGREA